jgi:hypothetical protein
VQPAPQPQVVGYPQAAPVVVPSNQYGFVQPASQFQRGLPVIVETVVEGTPGTSVYSPMYQGQPGRLAPEFVASPVPNPATLQVAKKYEDKVGHEMDYSWITGHLFYVHADGGRWVIRYALPGEVDKFGGSVVLAPGVEMRNFREGDLVCVTGQVLNEGRFSRSLGGALYRVDAINLVERSDP